MRWALRRRINLSRGSLDEPGRWPRCRRCRFCERGMRAAFVPAPVPLGASRRVVRRMSEPVGIQTWNVQEVHPTAFENVTFQGSEGVSDA